MRARSFVRSVVAAAFALAPLAALGCGSEPRVARVYDGRLVEGRFIGYDAYAAFLRGALAEESGDLRGALAAYGQALDEDEEDPEIEARIGATRCLLDPKDPAVDVAFANALKVDANSASALAANARCELVRGHAAQAATLAQRAATQDPASVPIAALASVATAHADPTPGDLAARERAIHLTETHGGHVAAWDALIAWGYARKAPELVERGLEGLLRVAPTRSIEVEHAVLALQRDQMALAHRLAAALADSSRELGVVGPRDPTVARLAVDEALTRSAKDRAIARATRGHVPLAEVAARALLLEHRDLALAIATSVVQADPGASGARMVRAALKEPSSAALSVTGPLANVSDQPPEICALIFASELATFAGVDAARSWLERTSRTPMSPRDPLAGPLALDLASRGVLPATSLPDDLRASSSRAHAKE